MRIDLTPKYKKIFDPLELPRRQRELVLCLGRGYSNNEIETAMHLTASSVKTSLFNLSHNAGMTRVELAVLGHRMLEVMAS